MKKSKFDKYPHNILKNKTIVSVKKVIFDRNYICLIINKLNYLFRGGAIFNTLIYNYLHSKTKYKSLYSKSEASKYLRRRCRF